MVSLVGLMNRDINSLFMPQNTGKGSNGASVQDLAQNSVESLNLNPSLTGNKAYTVQIVVERISIQMSSRTESTTPVQDGVSPLDFSPETTAQRIFDFSVGLFDVYKAQHPEESEETSLANFEQLVQDAVEEGFGEAQEILDSQGRLDDATSQFLTEIRSILNQLFDAFFHPGEAAETGEVQETGGNSTSSSQMLFELEYQSITLEFTSLSETAGGSSNNGQGAGAGLQNASVSYTSFRMESLSIALSYSEGAPASDFQMIA